MNLTFKDRLLKHLLRRVPEILDTFDPATGRFGEGIWICHDQNVVYPLAVAYAWEADGNPYRGDADLLEVITKAGEALIADANERGQWVFRKKDGSTWGDTWMPWTYSRWVRAFGLIRDDMAPDRRKVWADALTLGYTGISQHCLGHVHNIPTHHAMGLYAAGKALERPEWCEQAADFIMKAVGEQSEAGYWSEGGGPVVLYNFVYVEAIGTYYAMSGDGRVLPALERAAAYHRHFTYPGGQSVETIDQRNPYHDAVREGNVGFTFTPVGRAYLHSQWARVGEGGLSADLIASLLLYGEEGPVEDLPSADAEHVFVLTEDGADRAATLRRGPWFACLSAYTGAVLQNRWIQDRQSFVSIWHDEVGLILGGGNTKLQPAWSTFTVGDTRLLQHTPGDTDPDFEPKGELTHVASAAALVREPEPGLDLAYGPETCRVRLAVGDEHTLACRLEATCESGLPVAAHLTLLPHLGELLATGGGQELVLGESPIELSPDQVGGWVAHAGWRVRVPACASLHWPALPHNPYRKDGRGEPSEGRLEVRIPFQAGHREHVVTIHVGG